MKKNEKQKLKNAEIGIRIICDDLGLYPIFTDQVIWKLEDCFRRHLRCLRQAEKKEKYEKKL